MALREVTFGKLNFLTRISCILAITRIFLRKTSICNLTTKSLILLPIDATYIPRFLLKDSYFRIMRVPCNSLSMFWLQFIVVKKEGDIPRLLFVCLLTLKLHFSAASSPCWMISSSQCYVKQCSM